LNSKLKLRNVHSSDRPSSSTDELNEDTSADKEKTSKGKGGKVSKRLLSKKGATNKSHQSSTFAAKQNKTFIFSSSNSIYGQRFFKRQKYFCHICKKDKFYTYRQGFNQHMRIAHGGLNGSQIKFPCSVCGLSLNTKYSLVRHIRSQHTGERPFVCSECGDSFNQKQSLDGHIRSRHTREKPFVCSVCGKSFADVSNFRHHKETHNPRKYKCSHVHCLRKFKTIKTMKVHLETHKQNRYQCDICNKIMSSKHSLVRHMRYHFKPPVCDMCQCTFYSKHDFNKHLKSRKHLGKLHQQERENVKLQ